MKNMKLLLYIWYIVADNSLSIRSSVLFINKIRVNNVSPTQQTSYEIQILVKTIRISLSFILPLFSVPLFQKKKGGKKRPGYIPVS